MKYINFSILSTLTITSCLAGVPNLSNAAEADDVIVVTTNRRPQPLSQIGSSVSVLTEADLERGQQSFILDALETVPGISISQNGSFGGTASISMRGAGGDRTVLLVDGIQLNDASSTGGAYNFGTFDTYNVERIEVLRGPQSTLYGSDAIGGVINIITKTGHEGLGGKIFIEGGSYNTKRAGANLYGGTDKFGFNISASGIDTDGISAADENDGNTENDGLSSYTLSGKADAKLSENVRLETLLRYSDTSGEFDSFGPIDGDELSEVDQFSGAFRGYVDFMDGKFSNTLSVEYSKLNRQNLSNGVQNFKSEGERVNIDYIGVYRVDDNWTVTGGAQHEETKARTASPESFTIDSLLGEVAFTGVEGLVITSGMRYDDHETFGSKTTFRVTGSYEIGNTGTRLIANWGEGFKAPTIFQLTYFDPMFGPFVPASDLKPERAKGYEVGVEQKLSDDRVTLSATYFNLKIEDAITFVSGYENIARVRSRGFELGLDADLTNELSINATYTYTDSKDLLTNTTLPREAKHRATGSLQWNPTSKISSSVIVTYNGTEPQSSFSVVQVLDAWTRVDVRAAYEIMEGLSVYGRVDNILDKEYQHVPGYGTPDRSFYLGLRKVF